MKLNLNTILIILGGLGVFAPDIASVAAWLASMNIAWLGTVIKGMGLLAAFCSAAPLVVPRLRAFLALLGLATPPGASAPWDPRRDAGPPAAAPCTLVGNPNPPLGSPGPSSAGPVVRRGTYGPDDHGIAHLACLAALTFAAVLGILFAAARICRADEPAPQFGGCLTSQLCLGPSAAITIGEFNLATSKFSGGVLPGVGYGATFTPATAPWAATGLALYFSFKAGQDGPNQAVPSLMFSFANYVRLGAGVAITETSGPVQTQWQLLFGLGSDFGGSPKYVQGQQRNARLQGEADGMMRERASAGVSK